MHLEVTKDKKWRNNGKKFWEKQFSELFFFTKYYIIWDPGGSRKETDAMVASGMSF